MVFSAPVAEQRFVLDVLADIDALSRTEAFSSATPDMVEAILDGVGALSEDLFAPLNQLGDRQGARLTDEGVVMPEGFKQAYQAYVEGGWGALSVPIDQGGQGLPFSLATAVLENLGTANMAFSLIMMLSPGAVEAVLRHGSEAQKAEWLPKLITGEWNGTMNLTEPQAGSDVGALTTRAERQADGSYLIKGSKIFITFGEHDLTDNIVHLVLARTPNAPSGTRGISLFLVPRFRVDEQGSIGVANDVRCVSLEHKLGIHASPTCTMSFGDNDACVGYLIGEENTGMRAMFTMMNNARLNVGLQGVSIAERATQQAAEYARERIQSARAGSADRNPVAIVEHADVRRMLLTMKATTQAARALVYYAAGLTDKATMGDVAASKRRDVLIPLVKAYGTDIGVEVASLGVQVHGGMGYIEETGAAQHLRDSRITPIYEGTNGIQATDLVGRKLGLDGGEVVQSLLADIKAQAAQSKSLLSLLASVEKVVAHLRSSETTVDDQMAASVPFQRMLSVLVSGWLMLLQKNEAEQRLAAEVGDANFLKSKIICCQFYLEQLVPQASGLEASCLASADVLYALDKADF